MEYVESYSTVYTTFQKPTKFPSDSLATFKAQIETIQAHDGWSIYHPNLMHRYLAKICVEDIIMEKYDTDNMELTTMSLSCEENNMCMFNCI